MRVQVGSLDRKCISVNLNADKYNQLDEVSCAVCVLNFK